MPINIPSLHARLLNIAKEKGIELPILVNQLAGEQFLYRLSLSPYMKNLFLKEGHY